MLTDVGIEGNPVYRLVTTCDGIVYSNNSKIRIYLNELTEEVYCSDCIARIREEQTHRLDKISEEARKLDLSKFKATTVKEAIGFLKRREQKA